MATRKTGSGSLALGLASLMWLAATAALAEPTNPGQSILLATTTSVRDSGLLDVLLPPFTQETGIEVRAVAVGTGAALRMGAEGNADILLTHAPEPEKALLASGVISERREIMYNYFVIAGPEDDAAGVAAADRASQAMNRIRTRQAPFVSRADDSGTHRKEAQLFKAAGVDPTARWPGLTRTGSGMGASLLVAGQRRAYILSDIGTFLAFRNRVGLVPLSRPSPDLRNVYSVLLVNPERFKGVRGDAARSLADYLQSQTSRAILARFGTERFGQPLFSAISPASASR